MITIFLIFLFITSISTNTESCKILTDACFESLSSPKCVYSDDSPPTPNETPVNFTVALLGDSDVTPNANLVLKLIKDEGAELVIHSGDMGYEQGVEAWENQLNDVLGANFPYFIGVGNHDKAEWEIPDGYNEIAFKRLQKSGGTCIGRIGVAQACSFKGINFFISGVGTIKPPPNFLEDSLRTFKSPFKICSFHKNMHKMQLGSKEDQTGWEPYEICKQYGAIIATGHEHSYSRTLGLSSFENQNISDGDRSITYLKNGVSFAFVSGVAGRGIRPCLNGAENNPWWAFAGCSNSTPPLNYGSLFCKFNLNGISNKSYCYFKQIDGTTIDEFTIISTLDKKTIIPQCERNQIPKTTSPFIPSDPRTTRGDDNGNNLSSGKSNGLSGFLALTLILLLVLLGLVGYFLWTSKYSPPSSPSYNTLDEKSENDDELEPEKFTIE